MIHFTDEMRETVDGAFGRGFPCVVATASPSGEPGIGFKGSMMVLDDESLAYWERSKRAILATLEVNPRIVVLAADNVQHVYLRFHGQATIHRDGALREDIKRRVVDVERDKDPDGYGVVITVDKVTSLSGEVLQEREPSPTVA